MKLTSKLLKKMIMEEMQESVNLEKTPEYMEHNQGIVGFKKKLKNMALMPTSAYMGLSSGELETISGILDMLLAIGKEKSADATLNRIINFAQQAGNLKPEGEVAGEG